MVETLTQPLTMPIPLLQIVEAQAQTEAIKVGPFEAAEKEATQAPGQAAPRIFHGGGDDRS